MTHPGGGDSINLASLWVPVMPETSQIGGKMREAGSVARREFEQGFSGGGSGQSPEQLGDSFGQKFSAAFSKHLGGSSLGGLTQLSDRLSEEVDAKLAEKLRTKLPKLYEDATKAADQLRAAEERVNAVRQESISSIEANKNAEVNAKASITDATQRLAAIQPQMEAWRRGEITDTQEINTMMVAHRAATDELSSAKERLGNATMAHSQIERDAANQTRQAHEDVLVATNNSREASERYTNSLNEYHGATQRAHTAGSMFAGMLGGAMVVGIQAVVTGFEKLVELGAHIFEEAIHGAEELGEKLLEISEDYEHLSIQLTEYSQASGEAFSDMQERVEKIFGTLDVAGKDLGKTYAELGNLLNLKPGPELDELARSVTELQGRFSGLKAADLGTIFHAFKIPADQVNDALATLLENSRGAAGGLSQLTSTLSGDAAATLSLLGLSLGQAAHFAGELEKHGIPASKMMGGLSSAMKQFGKEGMSFKDGMAEAARELEAFGNTAAGDKLASTLFGGRKWTEAMSVIHEYQETISSTADAYDAPAAATQEFLDRTENLGNKIEEFKHHMEGTFKPFGDEIRGVVEHGLNFVSDWFDQHHGEIVNKIKTWGDSFIDLLPKIKEFGVIGLRLFEGVVAAASIIMAPFAEQLIAAGAGFLALTGHFTEAKDLMKFGLQMPLLEGKALGKFDDMLDKIDKLDLHTQDWKNHLNDAADAANRIPNVADTIAQGGMRRAFPSAPGATAPGGTAHHGWVVPHSAPGQSPAPSSSPAPGVGPAIPWGPPTTTTPSAPNLQGLLFPGAAPSGFASGAGGGGQGMGKAELAQAIYGAVIDAGYSPETALYTVADSIFESGLNPDIVNKSDHKGLFQESAGKPRDGAAQQVQWFLSTLDSLGGPDVVDRDPANIIANNVEIGGYPGSAYNSKLQEAASLLGFADGGLFHPVVSSTIGPDGRSRVPAPGEPSYPTPGVGTRPPMTQPGDAPNRYPTFEIPGSHAPRSARSAGFGGFVTGGPVMGFDTGGDAHGSLGDPGKGFIRPVKPGSDEWNRMSLAQQNMATWISMTMGIGGYETGGPVTGFDTGGDAHGSLGDPGKGFIRPVKPGSDEWNRMTLAQQNMATWISMTMGIGGYETGGPVMGFDTGGPVTGFDTGGPQDPMTWLRDHLGKPPPGTPMPPNLTDFVPQDNPSPKPPAPSGPVLVGSGGQAPLPDMTTWLHDRSKGKILAGSDPLEWLRSQQEAGPHHPEVEPEEHERPLWQLWGTPPHDDLPWYHPLQWFNPDPLEIEESKKKGAGGAIWNDFAHGSIKQGLHTLTEFIMEGAEAGIEGGGLVTGGPVKGFDTGGPQDPMTWLRDHMGKSPVDLAPLDHPDSPLPESLLLPPVKPPSGPVLTGSVGPPDLTAWIRDHQGEVPRIPPGTNPMEWIREQQENREAWGGSGRKEHEEESEKPWWQVWENKPNPKRPWGVLSGIDPDPLKIEETRKQGIGSSMIEEFMHGSIKQGLHQLTELVMEGAETGAIPEASGVGPGVPLGSRPGFATGGKPLSPKDTINAKLAPNEYVWNEQAVAKYGWFINWANWNALHGDSGKFTNGMPVRGFDSGGPASGVLQVIYDDNMTGAQVGEAGGALVGPGTSQPGYYRNDWKDHHGHVHTSFATGPNGEPYGLPVGTDIRPGAAGFPSWVYELGQQFGLTASTYPGHQEGGGVNRGIDWWPADATQDMSGQRYTPEQSSRLLSFAESVATWGSGGQGADAGGPQWSGADNYPDVSGAVGGSGGGGMHFSATGMGNGQYGGTADPGGGGGGFGGPGGVSRGGFPGLSGQYGGFGAYGGETQDQVEQHQRALTHARDRITDLGKEIKEKEEDRGRIADELTKLEAEPALTRDQKAIDAKKRELAHLDDEIAKIKNRELPEANQDLASQERKSQEAQYKQPEKGKKGMAGDASEEFGRNFLSGIAESLGFKDIFGGKPPWEFGAFKMAARFLSPFLGGGEGKGESGAGGGGLASMFGGGAQGMAGGLGLHLPNMALPGIAGLKTTPFQGGVPNVNGSNVTTPKNPGLGGQVPLGTAGAPGGGVAAASYHHTNNLEVNNYGPNQSDYDTWSAAMNSSAMQMSSAPGGLGAGS